MPSSMRVTNQQQVRNAINRYRRRFGNAVVGALYLEGVRIIRIANRLVPVDTGRLRATAYVEPPMPVGFGKARVLLGYGTDYALAVHENLEAAHTVGEARYLVNAVAARIPSMSRDFGRTVVRLQRLGRGLGVVGSAAVATEPKDPGAGWQKRKRETKRRKKRGRR